MGSLERSKKKFTLQKKAVIHFLFCFVMGFFSGFAPTSKPSIFSSQVAISDSTRQPIVVFHQHEAQISNVSLADETKPSAGQHHDTRKAMLSEEKRRETEEVNPRRLIIVVTPTSMKNKPVGVLLRRLANTLKLVAHPLLWVVVEKHSKNSMVPKILRKTGLMYRHLVFKENLTDADSEMDHQRNIALNHIEYQRLSGIVHFAGLSNVYDLSFFEEIRAIESFGVWPVAKLYANKNNAMIEGPVCDSSGVKGWHVKKRKNATDEEPDPIHISSFAFNSSILWDPERWGRASAVQDIPQDALKFVKEEVIDEKTRLQGIPRQGCSKILLWDLHMSKERRTIAFNREYI